MMLTAILIEDMPEAMQLLISDIEAYCPDIEVIGTANSVVSGSKLLRQKMPDIVFLDISLGDGTGFDLLEIFPDITASIIFLTAHEEYALRAFRYSATDYLLKPIDSDLLQLAVEKAKSKKQNLGKSLGLLKEIVKNPNQPPSKISLSTLDKIHVVDIIDIVRCESDVNNTWFILKNNEKVYVTKTLKHFEEILIKHHFVRVHQSHLVNFEFIQEFLKKDGGYLKLKNGNEIPVSVRKKQEVLQLLDELS